MGDFEDLKTRPNAGFADDTGSPASSPIEFVTIDMSERQLAGAWIAAEVWTRNRIYRMNASQVCLEVVDRETGDRQQHHSLLGKRLVGGQRKLGASVWLCHPLPLPGSDAVFEQSARAGRRSYVFTSAVDRVIVRVGSRVVPPSATEATWDALTAEPGAK
ncbi:MAG TPA: hypothetical protein VGQ83_01890 [Polyangia bacterium]